MRRFPEAEIGSICTLINGRAFKPSDWKNVGLPIVRIQNLNNPESEFNYFDGQVQEKFLIDSGELLFSWSGTPGTSFGAFFWSRGKAVLNQHIFRVLVNESEVSKDYLRYALNYRIDRIIAQSHGGVGLKHITKGKLEATTVPLPPLAEQRRIAAILDKADAIRRKRKQAIQYTEELLRATFLDMFGDPVTNPKGWEVKPLGDLLQNIESGWSPKCEAREANPDEWGVLKLSAVTYGHFDSHENKAMLPENNPRPELEIKQGDLLVTRKNTYELVGASAFVQKTRPNLMLPDLIFRLKLKDGIEPIYLWQALSQTSMRFQLSGLAGGTSGSMPNISKSRLRTLSFPVPPIELQSKYRALVNQFWLKKTHQDYSQTASENLLNSLLQRAFRGEL